MVGAGAVGVVLTRALEVTKANEITYYVRKGRKALLTRVKVHDLRSGQLHVRERPIVVEAGAKLPVVDTVFLAVRADQLVEALDVVAELEGEPRICSTTAGLDDLAQIRARFPGRPAVQILPIFLSYLDDDAFRFAAPPFLPSLISDGGDSGSRAFAEELAGMLKVGGLGARAVGELSRSRDAAFAAGLPLLGALELAGFDFTKLAGDASLRDLASKAAQEGLRSGPLGLAALGIKPFLSLALRAAPALPADMRAMWLVHGPKIAGQTRLLLDGVIARVEAAGKPSVSLRELRRRLV